MEKQMNMSNQNTIRFEEGLYGFEDVKEYILLKEDPDGSVWNLQAAKDGVPSLIVLNPFLFIKEYAPRLSDADLQYFENPKMEDLCFLVVAVLKENMTESAVNLKSPIVIDVNTRKGKQIILENQDYPVRYKLFAEKA